MDYSINLFKQSSADLVDDFLELLWLIDAMKDKLNRRKKLLHKTISKPTPELFLQISTLTERALRDYDTLKGRAREGVAQSKLAHTKTRIHALTLESKIIKYLIRTLQSTTAATVTAADWQSPTFLHSGIPLAGSQTGRILETINDYKRDLHIDGHEFEQAFKKEYIDALIKLPIALYATTSGMAAVSTVLSYLVLEENIQGPVLTGTSVYYEVDMLLRKTFETQLVRIDEMNTDAFVKTIERIRPQVVWLDTLTNTENIAVPNMARIIDALEATKKSVVLVVDNSCLACSYQPISDISFRTNIRLIVIESLNKYYQFGLDRITGGIIWTLGTNLGKLTDYRVHLGTNIPDISTHMIPPPNRAQLTKRLARFERNALIVAGKIRQYLNSHKTPLLAVSYPGLSTYEGFTWTKDMPFHGSFLTLQFKERFATIPFYQRFVKTVIARAKKQNVDIVSGTSFGMDTTRIYLTAIRADIANPFIRISVGTEHKADIERVAQILCDAIQKLS